MSNKKLQKIKKITRLEHIEGKTTLQAVQEVYPNYKYSSAQALSSRLRDDPRYIASTEAILDKFGYGKEAAIQKHIELTKAKKSIVCDKEVIEVDDNTCQLESNRDILKMVRALGSEGTITDARSINTYVIGDDAIARLEEIAKRMQVTAQAMHDEEASYDCMVIEPKQEPSKDEGKSQSKSQPI